ncbi:MAG: hypothetical protein IRZ05_11720 [Micromonosporaceae bacterium]|nr:hypothetical protein [Micromonosporaceae bacterium]
MLVAIWHVVTRDLLDELVPAPEGAICAEIVDPCQSDGIIRTGWGAGMRRASHAVAACPAPVDWGCPKYNDIHQYSDILDLASRYVESPVDHPVMAAGG